MQQQSTEVKDRGGVPPGSKEIKHKKVVFTRLKAVNAKGTARRFGGKRKMTMVLKHSLLLYSSRLDGPHIRYVEWERDVPRACPSRAQ